MQRNLTRLRVLVVQGEPVLQQVTYGVNPARFYPVRGQNSGKLHQPDLFLVANKFSALFVAMMQNKLQVFVTRFAVVQISFLLTSSIDRLGTVQPCLLNFVRHFKEAQLFEVRGCQRLF